MASATDDAPVHRADSRTRRLSLLVIAGTTVAGVLGILAFERYRPALEVWLERDPASTVPLLLGLLVLLGPVPALGIAWLLWRFGRRTIDAGRFPPPGLRLVRDEPRLTAEAARRRGRILAGFALLLCVAAIGLAVALWRLGTLVTGAAR